MAVSDEQLIRWLLHSDQRIRSASLDLLSSSYCSSPEILNNVRAVWNRDGVETGFRDFPLISHLSIAPEKVGELLVHARQLVAGRKLTDRACRCAGKLLEAISVERASTFAPHLEAIRGLKQESKIFFRVPIESMELRAAALEREASSLHLDFEDGRPADIAIALESLWERGEADRWIERGMQAWSDSSIGSESVSPLAVAVLELVSRHSIRGVEESLITLVDRYEASVADLATIGLVRGRNPQTQRLIAERFPKMSRSGQLRSLDLIRRMRLPQSSELVRFLLPHGVDITVQNGARSAEVMLFDFKSLEDWLEAFLLLDATSVQRLEYAIPIVSPLAQEVAASEWPRIKRLMLTRLGRGFEIE
jgi:hypothetical protein